MRNKPIFFAAKKFSENRKQSHLRPGDCNNLGGRPPGVVPQVFSCAGSCPRFVGGVNWRCLNNCGASHSNHVCQITISLRSEIRIRHNFWDSLSRSAPFCIRSLYYYMILNLRIVLVLFTNKIYSLEKSRILFSMNRWLL